MKPEKILFILKNHWVDMIQYTSKKYGTKSTLIYFKNLSRKA